MPCADREPMQVKVASDTPVIHLFPNGSAVAHCGVLVGKVVSYREFSEHPCPGCIQWMMV